MSHPRRDYNDFWRLWNTAKSISQSTPYQHAVATGVSESQKFLRKTVNDKINNAYAEVKGIAHGTLKQYWKPKHYKDPKLWHTHVEGKMKASAKRSVEASIFKQMSFPGNLIDLDYKPPKPTAAKRTKFDVTASATNDGKETRPTIQSTAKTSSQVKDEARSTEMTNKRIINADGPTIANANAVAEADESPIEQGMPTVFEPYPPVVQTFLPYDVYNATGTFTAFNTSAGVTTHTFRLNSIYDCNMDGGFTYPTYIDATLGAAGVRTADGSINTPKMRGYWSAFYQYWTVLKCEWRVVARNVSTSLTNEICMYTYIHGAQFPPEVDDNGTVVLHDFRKRHPHCNAYRLKSVATAQRNNDFENTVVASGTFIPGQTFVHEVGEDEQKQTWHTIAEVPPTCEYLTLMFQSSPHATTAEAGSYVYDIHLHYTAQWKDLKHQFQYLTGYGNLPAVTDFALQAN